MFATVLETIASLWSFFWAPQDEDQVFAFLILAQIIGAPVVLFGMAYGRSY